MKRLFAVLCLSILSLAIPTPACAQDDAAAALAAARASARRNLEAANIELRLYLQVDYPREQRHLDAQIKLAEAEVKAYEERIREYRSFEQFSTGRPLLLAVQDVRLCLLEAQLRFDNLRAERNAAIRFHSDRWRLLELRAYEARSRVAELERDLQPVAPAAVARQ